MCVCVCVSVCVCVRVCVCAPLPGGTYEESDEKEVVPADEREDALCVLLLLLRPALGDNLEVVDVLREEAEGEAGEDTYLTSLLVSASVCARHAVSVVAHLQTRQGHSRCQC